MKESMIKKAVIPCGGLGTRFLPITKGVAKEMLPIIDRPVLDILVDEAAASGIEEILIIISPNKGMIKEYFRHDEELINHLIAVKRPEYADIIRRVTSRVKISFEVQQVANGSGDAMLLAEKFCADEPFVLMLGDDVMVNDEYPVTAQLIDVYNKYRKTVLGVQRRALPEILRYGVIDVLSQEDDSVYSMRGILEKPKAEELTSDLCTLGRYVITPEIFQVLKNTPFAANGELQLTDGLNILCKKLGSYAYVFDGVRYDMGDKFGSLTAITEFALKDKALGSQFRDYIKNLAKTL